MLIQVILIALYAQSTIGSQVVDGGGYTTIINDVKYDIITTDFLLSNNPRDTFKIDTTSYYAGPMWAIFRLSEGPILDKIEWSYNGGFRDQADSCDPNAWLYRKHEYTRSFLETIGVDKPKDCDWCVYSVIERTRKIPTFSLKVHNVLVYSNYVLTRSAGLSKQEALDDWTISLALNTQNYSNNGVIRSFFSEARELSTLRLTYDPSVSGSPNLNPAIHLVESLPLLTAKPDFEILDDLDCMWGLHFPYPMPPVTIAYKYKEVQQQDGFSWVSVLRPGRPAKELPDIFNVLTMDGLVPLNEQKFIVDPCLELIYPIFVSGGRYYTRNRAGTGVLVDTTMCVIVQDRTNTRLDLGLYSFSSDASTLVPSKRFTGVLSRDYLKSVTARITTNYPVISEQNFISLSIQFTDDKKLNILSATKTSCHIFVSPNCTKEASLEAGKSATIDISTCLPIYSRVQYDCQASTGWVSSPTQFSTLTATTTDFKTQVGWDTSINKTRNNAPPTSQWAAILKWIKSIPSTVIHDIIHIFMGEMPSPTTMAIFGIYIYWRCFHKHAKHPQELSIKIDNTQEPVKKRNDQPKQPPPKTDTHNKKHHQAIQMVDKTKFLDVPSEHVSYED